MIRNIIQICSGITSGSVLDGELLYTMILEVNLFAFTYRLFHADFSSIIGALKINFKSILIKQVIVYLFICLSVRLWTAKPQGLTG